MAAGAGSSSSLSFWVASRISLPSLRIASSSARTDFSRPTNRGTGWCGKTTMSRRGRIGRIFISDMMLQLLAGPLGPRARRPGRGHPDDAPESDDPSRHDGGCFTKQCGRFRPGFKPSKTRARQPVSAWPGRQLGRSMRHGSRKDLPRSPGLSGISSRPAQVLGPSNGRAWKIHVPPGLFASAGLWLSRHGAQARRRAATEPPSATLAHAMTAHSPAAGLHVVS